MYHVRDTIVLTWGVPINILNKILEYVGTGELEYWTERRNPPNLEPEDFKALLPMLVGCEISSFEMKPRESNYGVNAHHGEDDCFYLNIQKPKLLTGGITEYFIKGYFYPKGVNYGVVIQSFRKKEVK